MEMEKNYTKKIDNPYGMVLKKNWTGFWKCFDDKPWQDLFNYRTVDGDTALHIAAASGNHKLLKRLLEKLPKEPRKIVVEALMKRDIHGNTALHEVATTDCVEAANEMVEIILQCSDNENEKKLLIRNKLGETPLYRAAALGHNKMLKYFDYKVGFSRCHFHRKDDISVLDIAVIGQHFDTAIWLLKKEKQLANEETAEISIDLENEETTKKDGMTALQLLALMPSAFESSSPRKKWNSFFYSCICALKFLDDHDDDDDDDYKDDMKTVRSKMHRAIWRHVVEGCWKINKIWKEKQKHKEAVKLVKLLVEKDKSWEKGFDPETKESDPTISLGLGKGSMNKEKKLVDLSDEELVKLLKKEKLLPEGEYQPEELVELLVEKDKPEVLECQKKSSHGLTETKVSLTEIPLVVEKDKPEVLECQKKSSHGQTETKVSLTEIPLVFAASNGITEIFDEIIEQNPRAINYVNDKGENVLHVAIKYRQKKIFEGIQNYEMSMPKLASRIDNDGNTILHHVANTELFRGTRPGPALQFQEELEWFERVKDVMPDHYAMHRNKTRKITASDLFDETHADQLLKAQQWMKETAQSCSTLSILMATVVFAVAFTVPGGNNDQGFPNFLHSPLFYVFSIIDVASLAFSLSSVVMFLSILTSPFESHDFLRVLPTKLIAGFTFLFISVITSMVAFSASLLLIIRLDKKWTAALYTAAFFPVIVLALMQFPFYASLVGDLKDYYKKFKKIFPRKKDKEGEIV